MEKKEYLNEPQPGIYTNFKKLFMKTKDKFALFLIACGAIPVIFCILNVFLHISSVFDKLPIAILDILVFANLLISPFIMFFGAIILMSYQKSTKLKYAGASIMFFSVFWLIFIWGKGDIF